MRLLAFATVCLLACGGMSQAQPLPCGQHDQIVGALLSAYGEVPMAMALNPSGAVIEWLANLDTGTWSMVVSTPMSTCLVHSGTGWQMLRPLVGQPT